MIHFSSFTLLGNARPSGTYLLRIAVTGAVEVYFGRFRQRAPVLIPAGDYLYLGSALANRGSMSLPYRLLRHASRTAGKPAHVLRQQLWLDLQTLLPKPRLTLPTSKKLRWHVDFLLDELAAELVHIFVIGHHKEGLERELGQLLLACEQTAVLIPGLGATDIPGNTHLLAVHAPESWWQTLASEIIA